MRVLIADDEPIARDILREHIESMPGIDIVGEAATGPEALQQILDTKPDLVLLDLQMPALDGLSVVRSLQGNRMPQIVFVTAYEQYALGAFDVGALDYLLKPVRRERLAQAIEKARRNAPQTAPMASAARKIVGRRGTDLYLLDPADIVAFQAEGELVHILSANPSSVVQRYHSDHSLKQLEQMLDRARFRRVHRATIINTDHIRRISPLSSKRWLLKMSSGFEAVVSKRMVRSFKFWSRSAMEETRPSD